MTQTDWIKVTISGLLTYIITAGGALIATIANAPEQPLSPNTVLVIVATGLIAAAKDVKTYMAIPPTKLQK